MYDVIIIGAGPAGISAGLYTKRSNLNVLILHNNETGLEKAHKIENYYGFVEGISGRELYDNGIKQAKNIGIEVKEDEIKNIEMKPDFSFIVKSVTKEYETKSIIIATGNKKAKPNIVRN